MVLKNRVMKKMKKSTSKKSKEEDMHEMLSAVVLQMQLYESQLEDLLKQKKSLETTVESLHHRSLAAITKLEHIIGINKSAVKKLYGVVQVIEEQPTSNSEDIQLREQSFKEKLQDVICDLTTNYSDTSAPLSELTPSKIPQDPKSRKLRDILKLTKKSEGKEPNKAMTEDEFGLSSVDIVAQQSPILPKASDQSRSVPISQKAKRNRIHLFVISSDEEEAKTAAHRTPNSSKKQFRDSDQPEASFQQDGQDIRIREINEVASSSQNIRNRTMLRNPDSSNINFAKQLRFPKKPINFEESNDGFISPPEDIERKDHRFDFNGGYNQPDELSEPASYNLHQKKESVCVETNQLHKVERPGSIQFRKKRIIIDEQPLVFQRSPLKTSTRSSSLIDQQPRALENGEQTLNSTQKQNLSKDRLPSSHKIIPLHPHAEISDNQPNNRLPAISISKTFRKLISRVLNPFGPSKTQDSSAAQERDFPWV